ncbi:hypothetical protein B0H94_107194 [Salsuginibacillus halophilus]|uniref:Cytokinin riboside 5'-monophosphate phosphoribohydrolase n=1 Tax=Salsuginibacillus halophilus TaxID=517424 RepID=A0A2P8HG45_9BACI|nr:TIGR00730 family Rossman fold protein [Salsuginibacillus halophilus]PSL45189.1 hypothetical protein B0H94_107194 [Salsuginibacillus halophilus]
MQAITIFCGSRPGRDEVYSQAAYALGQEAAKAGLRVIYGGGSSGLMGAVAEGALAEGGKVTGVIPYSLKEKELAHDRLTELITVHTMHERKAQMYDQGDAFIALPGGIGTLEEFMEILTWHAIGAHAKPCGILNTNGYYDPMYDLLRHMTEEAFVTKETADRILLEDEPAKLIQQLQHQEGEPYV